jgi:hypothetical protein
VKERVKSPYRINILLPHKYGLALHIRIELFTHFSEVQSDRVSLHPLLDGSELLCTIHIYTACFCYSFTQDTTIRPVLKHGPRSSTGLRVVEFLTKLITGEAKANMCDV